MYSVTEEFIKWLSGLEYDAYTYPPADAPDEFVVIERTGGNVENMVDYPTIAIQTWAKNQPRAEELANAIRNELLTSSKPYGVHHVTVNSGPYPFWDESTRLPRYQTVYDCTAYLTD